MCKGVQSLSAFLHLANCTHAYLDVGSNIGVQIRKLFEPQKYANAPVVQVFQQIFGPAPHCNVCAIGIEPNVRHADRLLELERRLTNAHAHVAILRVGAATTDGEARFVVPNFFDAKEDWAARIPVRSGHLPIGFVDTRVQTLDLAALIRRVRAAITGQLVMKLDVEGQEQLILPHLVATSALCLVDFALIEWHQSMQWHKEFYDRSAQGLFSDSDLQQALRKTCASCPVQVVTLDDETYLHDGMSWPNASLCARPAMRNESQHVAMLAPDDQRTPVRGLCGNTLPLSGSCEAVDSGAWSMPKTLSECVMACRQCNRCNYVSFSKQAHHACSWFHACQAPLRTRGTFRTLRVRSYNHVS